MGLIKNSNLRVLSIGGLSAYGKSNTCLHRHNAIKKNANTVHEVDTANTKVSLLYKITNKLFNLGFPINLPDSKKSNKKISRLIQENKYDIVWIDKGLTIKKKTLKLIKQLQPNCKIVSFSPDNMMMRFNQSQNFLNCRFLYDYTFTTKSFIVQDLKDLGFKNVFFINKTYHEEFHYPRELTLIEEKELGGDVGFIGAWEEERCHSILYLVDNGIKVKVFGNKKWKEYIDYHPNLEIREGLFSDNYPKALRAFKISLCFLRKMNNDQQTARTMEIPACGGFMMAERTKEHQILFKEGKEAEYFSTNEELLNKCNYYLKKENKEIRLAIINSGIKRCEKSGYSNEKTIAKMMKIVLGKNEK
ncbi:glycosyltransferase [Polaribacter vadi]|uniref:CgeB family protein n=1 Tax=Polaribacter TaxID=52959 RepID=UPI001C08C8D0|nr:MULTISPECIES: glycosyltransferase [Polaribacter]MBU3010334.1 glycosyltransferase [Polaribacter vadi]MDO6740141.1 glycosyltransferase [Polaribacter sp. 1_MG-2023]